jgi:hypothetical protein
MHGIHNVKVINAQQRIIIPHCKYTKKNYSKLKQQYSLIKMYRLKKYLTPK